MKAYRLLTEDDTAAFCHKVSDALAKGWSLYGDPAYAARVKELKATLARLKKEYKDNDKVADWKKKN